MKENWIELAKSSESPIPFDTANLLYNVAWTFAAQVYHGDYTSALAKLKRLLLFHRLNKLKLLYVLDGVSNPYKAPENFRRRKKREEADLAILAAIKAGETPDIVVVVASQRAS